MTKELHGIGTHAIINNFTGSFLLSYMYLVLSLYRDIATRA
jgi:hypothetical protein